MVVSGINLGANLGDDVLYSGTVAAALEGRFLGGPRWRSRCCRARSDNLPTAAYFARKLVEAQSRLDAAAHRAQREYSQPAAGAHSWHPADPPGPSRAGGGTDEGGRSARQGRLLDCRAGDAEDGGPGTDFHAVMQGYVSITPLQLDRTFNDAFSSSTAGWRDCADGSNRTICCGAVSA
jgi:5'-nucleotidase